MSLSALVDGKLIQSFALDDASWVSLKSTYKHRSVLMPCCYSGAVPKVSKLGNKFFAHSKQGECSTAAETSEHIFLKTIVAQAAQMAGWEVQTEARGFSSNNEPWIADVLCSRGDSKFAIEIQWSAQSKSEFLRRQNRYADSGVRALWLYRLKGRRNVSKYDWFSSESLPVFAFRARSNRAGFEMSQYSVTVEKFVSGIFNGKLCWTPRVNDSLVGILEIAPDRCWRCGKLTNLLLGFSVFSDSGLRLGKFSFTDPRVPSFLLLHFGDERLRYLGVGTIKSRYSKTVSHSYISNGCFHCDALMGNFFLSRLGSYVDTDLHNLDLKFFFPYSSGMLPITSQWLFDGSEPAYMF